MLSFAWGMFLAFLISYVLLVSQLAANYSKTIHSLFFFFFLIVIFMSALKLIQTKEDDDE